jgi:hypothetical protein
MLAVIRIRIRVACGLTGPYYEIFVILLLLADCGAVIPLHTA